MNLKSRLARLESASPDHRPVPRLWVTPSWCPLDHAQGHDGEFFHRAPGETEGEFKTRVQGATDAPLLTGIPITELAHVAEGDEKTC